MASCEIQDLIDRATCVNCDITGDELDDVIIYLLCVWANTP